MADQGFKLAKRLLGGIKGPVKTLHIGSARDNPRGFRAIRGLVFGSQKRTRELAQLELNAEPEDSVLVGVCCCVGSATSSRSSFRRCIRFYLRVQAEGRKSTPI